jgi:hypothetical protein
MVSTGDRIRVDGAEATVTARHASGKHTRFTLSDGRVLLDLQKRGDVELLAGKAPALESKPKRDRKVVLGGGDGLVKPQPTGTVEDFRDDVRNGEDFLD